MSGSGALSEKALALACKVPEALERLHRLCAETLNDFADGAVSVHTPAYVCNMVDSRLIPLTECLIREYADGVLLTPQTFW